MGTQWRPDVQIHRTAQKGRWYVVCQLTFSLKALVSENIVTLDLQKLVFSQ